VLYNEQALVVLDRNGGRITHLFAMVNRRPVAVSGTYKAYQSLDLDWASDAGSECDGLVLQNTVATPNHAYVAGDVDASGTTGGESPTPGELYGWAYPDNFNAYVEQACDQADGPAVAFTYGDTVPADITLVTKPRQHQQRLIPAGQRPRPGPGAPDAPLGTQQRRHLTDEFTGGASSMAR
jgi:hypothetical protein